MRKGRTLVELDGPEETREVWDEIVNRFAASPADTLRYAAERALLNKATHDLAPCEQGIGTPCLVPVDDAMKRRFSHPEAETEGGDPRYILRAGFER